MADEKELKMAREVFSTLCSALDARKWKYEKNEEELIFKFNVSGEDIPMEFLIKIDAGRKLVRLLSFMPFKMSKEKRVEGAIATSYANYRLADGSFDYNVGDGRIIFRMTSSYRESLIGEEMLQYMIGCSCTVVDKYNDQFLMLDKGVLSIEDFIKAN